MDSTLGVCICTRKTDDVDEEVQSSDTFIYKQINSPSMIFKIV